MDRRSFFKSLAKGVLTATAACYAPKLLEPARMTFQGIPIRRDVYTHRWPAQQLQDWREAIREANGIGYVAGQPAGKTDVVVGLARAMKRLNQIRPQRPVFYISRETFEALTG